MLLFISDLHLQENRPQLTQGFIRFLEQQATQAEALYILGDFFDVWVGDDAMTTFHKGIAAALRQTSEQGTAIYLMHGNRDFALGPDFCHLAGCTLLPDPYLLTSTEPPLLLMHGDLLCTDDLAYQRMRRFLRNPLVFWLLSNLPLRFRQKIAAKARQASQTQTALKAEQITDANPQAVIKTLEEYQATQLIHGHTHRPAIHPARIELDGQALAAKRYVLGDWSDEEGWKIQVQKGVIELIRFNL